MNCAIRDAGSEDCALLVAFIRKLAEFEGRLDTVAVTEEILRRDMFGLGLARALIVECGSRPAGFALYYYSYASFTGKPALFLEDLFIEIEYRHRGFARAVFSRLFDTAASTGCARLEWDVLNWNTDAIAFYRSLGASPKLEWQTWALTVPRENK